jgi:hypothetical protein
MLEVSAEMHVGLYINSVLFLSDLDQNLNKLMNFGESPKYQIFMQIH